METALQNGLVWLGPCQSTQKTTVQGKISSHWFSVKAPLSPGKVANTGHQLLSAGSPLWIWGEGYEQPRRELEKLVDIKRKKKTPHTRTQDRRGGDNSLSHASFLKLSRLFFSENGGGGREASTNPTFIYAARWEQFQWEFLMLFHVPWILLVVESLFSLNCSDLISICLKTGTHTQCDCKSSFT